MELSNAQRAQVLIHALPCIQKYTGKILVVKYGGNAMVNEELKQAVMGDLVLLSLIGVKVVLVHGGGPEISEMLQRVGKESQFMDGLRVTDKETADIVQMVLAGKLCKSLVSLLQSKGGKAIGLSGMDGYLIQAKPLRPELGYVGETTHINVEPVLDVLEKGYIPVISTVGCDAEGNVYNINSDTAAARIAAELKAESLISMTDICGILQDKDDPLHPDQSDHRERSAPADAGGCDLRRHDSQGGMLHRGHPPGREPGVHHRRAHPPRHPDRDPHRRGHRYHVCFRRQLWTTLNNWTRPMWPTPMPVSR